MKIEIKIKTEDEFQKHIFQDYSIEQIKFMLKHHPDKLLDEIERLEKALTTNPASPEIESYYTHFAPVG